MYTPEAIGTPLTPSSLKVLLLGASELGRELAIALQRLGEGVLAGARDPSHFKERAGEKQDLTDLKLDSKYSWLEPWCAQC